MHKPSIQALLFKTLFPRPRQGDPTTLHDHIRQNLIPEVRTETTNFYGAIDCPEAQFPGLDYSYPPHRRRLACFPWHRRLFRAFDELRLTKNEIWSFCTWEGTKAEKENYEASIGRRIRDTTIDGIAPADEIRPPLAQPAPDPHPWQAQPQVSDFSRNLLEAGTEAAAYSGSEDDVDVLANNYDDALSLHLQAAAAARAAGTRDFEANEQWEQWLKEAMERNELDVDGMLEAIRQGRPFSISPSHILDASVHPPTLGLASGPRAATGPVTPTLTMVSNARAAPRGTTAMNNTQVAMANVWNLGNQIVRSVHGGNVAIIAPSSANSRTAAEAR